MYIKEFKLIICLFIIFIILPQCKQDSHEPIAIMGNDTIYLSDIDSKLTKKLHDQLYLIYTLRKQALDEIIINKMLITEADKFKLSLDMYLDSIVFGKITDTKITEFAKENFAEEIPVQVNDEIHYQNYNTIEGRINLIEIYKKQLLVKHLDSIKQYFNIEKHLYPPSNPQMDLNSIKYEERGNLNSKIELWSFVSLECSGCNEIQPILDSLFLKYENVVKFKTTYYSSNITQNALMLKAASLQHEFWAMFNVLKNYDDIQNNQPIKEEDLIKLAYDIGLDVNKFLYDMNDKSTYYDILNQYKLINEKGISITPLILVNDRIVYVENFDHLDNVIKKEL